MIMIYLASGSPRRAELLQQIGIEFETLHVDIDESQKFDESALDYVKRMAKNKAQAGALLLTEQGRNQAVLAADTIIAIDDKIIGKPADRQQCQRILSQLSARQHQVISSVALLYRNSLEIKLSINRVWFRALRDSEIKSYCTTEEPMDKAGAYAIQGRAAIFIKHLEGSYSSVMGLPLFETAELLQDAGISV
jgi:septum formation protein